MSSLFQDLRVAFRVLAKERAFTIVTVLTLAVAIGANTAIFSVAEGVLLKPLPYPNADRLVSVEAGVRPGPGRPDWIPFSDRGYWHFVNNNRAFQEFGAYSAGDLQWPLVGDDGPPVQVDVSAMTRSAFELLGTRPRIGRLPTAEEDAPQGPRVVLISEGLWRDRYGSDPGIIGKSIDLNGMKWEVIGVMPSGYDFPTPEIDVWIPHQLDPASENFGGHHLNGIARMKPGVTVAQAVSDAESLIARFPEAGYGPVWMSGVFNGKARVRTFRDALVSGVRTPLLILLGTMAVVLLIACSNVTNLLLVRAEARTRENAVRLALGSGRGRLIRYVLVESVVLALVGAVLGIGLAYLGTRALIAAAPASVPRLDAIGLDGTVLLYTLGVSLVAALLLAILPALRVSARKVLLTLNDAGRGAIGRQRLPARSVLVVLEVALALMLLVGSGLMIRSYRALRSVDPGFDAKGVMTFRLSPTPAKYGPGEPVVQFYTQLAQKLEAIPGVTSASGINSLPLTGLAAYITANIEEFPTPEGEFPHAFHFRRVMPGYFKTMGIPVLEGREFTTDDDNSRLGTIIISEAFKKQFWPDVSALNKRITIGGAPAHTVGVVGDVHNRGLDSLVEQVAYKPMLDSVGGGVRAMMMVVRTDGDPKSLVPAIREAVTSLDPDLPITDVRTMQDIVDASLSRTTFTMSLLLLGALIALFLGSVGIYGVLTYVANQRTAEMGVRSALGADAGRIRKIFLSHGMALAGTGVVLGLVAAIALSRVMRSLLFGVKPLDPATLVGVSVIFLAVAGLASIVPAERAARVHPADALRGS